MRLIDIEDMALLKTVSCGGLSAKKLWKRIKEQPTIDAVEVVRCKDCKHRYMDGEVTHYYWCRLHDRPVDDTDYCAWGEERSEE